MTLVTINNQDPWKYLDLLNECVKIILTIAAGIICGYGKVFDSSKFIPQSVQFVFNVALPCHIAKGIGIGVDFYDDAFLWDYILAFLVLRAIALVIAFGVVLVASKRDANILHGIGEVTVVWLSMTWISTVILGIPIAKAVFNDARKGAFYGLLAGISSFIFQLPLQLLFLECHKLEEDLISPVNLSPDGYAVDDLEHSKGVDALAHKVETSDAEISEVQDHPVSTTSSADGGGASAPSLAEVIRGQSQTGPVVLLWTQFALRGDVWARVLHKMMRNPVLWGIAVGFALSLSTIGPTYLFPGSPDRVPALDWIWGTLGWLGDIVSPLSLFTMGLWMSDQGKRLFRVPLSIAALSMTNKLLLVPIVMVGLAKAFDLNDEASRAAVLIACLPISMASFSLASNYKIGEAFLSENVALGTALMLPTVIVWNVVMDHLKLFPLPSDR